MTLWVARGARIAVAGVMAIAVVGCTSSGPGSSGTSIGPSGAKSSTTAGPLSASPSASGGPAKLPVYNEGGPRSIPPGTYITTAPDGFFPGMTLTIPAGWSSTETDSGELALKPDDRPDDAIFLWKDMVAVVRTNEKGTAGNVLEGVDSSADALVKWMTSNKDMEILSKPKAATVGDGIKGVQLTLTQSRTVNFADDDCPDNPHCVAIVKDPGHWGDNFYAIGGAEVSRIYVTALHYPNEDHTFWVTLDAVSVADLTKFAAEAKPILDSLRLPQTYVVN